jgi:regulatory protein
VLSDAEIAVLRTQDEHNRAFNQALRFLSYRPRSRLEIERYLRDKSLPETVIDDVISRLERSQYLDDEAFARFWVENREQFRPRGERALRYELRQKGISDAIITDVLGNLDDEAAAWHAVEGRLRRWAGLPAEEFRRKVAGYLSRRGFGYDTVSVILTKANRSLNIED